MVYRVWKTVTRLRRRERRDVRFTVRLIVSASGVGGVGWCAVLPCIGHASCALPVRGAARGFFDAAVRHFARYCACPHRAYRDTCFFPAAPGMAADAAVLVALRRQSSFSHRSLDGGGPLDRCTDASDTSAALRPNSCLELAGPAAQLSSPLSARDVARWFSLHL